MAALFVFKPTVDSIKQLYIGSSQVKNIMLGDTPINKVYKGDQLIWERYPSILQTDEDMQAINATNCPITRTRVRDARDGATYWIRKIPNTKGGGGDLCWMETNLAYAGGGDNTYGDAMPPIIEGIGSADALYEEPRYFVHPDSNRTSGTQDPSLSMDGGKTNPQYGYYYNWCAAMGGQPAACQGTTATQPNQSKNPGNGTIYNICPAGWRLPTGGGGGEQHGLNNATNGGSSNNASGLLANDLFMYAGTWSYSLGTFSDVEVIGYLLSSTIYQAHTPYAFYFYPSLVFPVNNTHKQTGASVRCVAE